MKAAESAQIIIGYYSIRGKAQVPRLICEYLGVNYRDELYELVDWDKFKRQSAKKWDFIDIPYMMDGDFILTEAFPICEYIIQKEGAMELLGKTVEDQAIVQMYLWTIDTMGSIININCSKIPEAEVEEFKEKQWKNNVHPRMMKYEQFIRGQEWFLGYLTIIDFSIYELIRYMEMLFPNHQSDLPKLNYIRKLIETLPQIADYEKSDRAVREMDPSVLMKRYKEKAG